MRAPSPPTRTTLQGDAGRGGVCILWAWPARASCARLGSSMFSTAPFDASGLNSSPARGRLVVHLWNNELHNEEIAHCEKLIVNNEPPLAHYWNNEPTMSP